MTEWSDLAGWWLDELAFDPAYTDDVERLLFEMIAPQPGERWLDLGCGEGRTVRRLRSVGVDAIGCDLNAELLSLARHAAPVIQCRLPDLGWARPDAFDGASTMLTLEHLPGLDLFAEVYRVVRPGGSFAVVMNHPLYTAPGSGPVVDPTDGEVFWRWGNYLEPGATTEAAGAGEVTFYHRPLSTLLSVAADAGWRLEKLAERPIVKPELAGQDHIPRLLGARWRRPF